MKFPVCPNFEPDDTFFSNCIGCSITQEDNKGCPLKKIEEGVYEVNEITPAKGVKAMMYFTIVGKKYRSKENAKFLEIQELDKDGGLIAIDHAFKDEMENLSN